MPKAAKQAADYIVPLNMNGLDGRMLVMPGPKSKNREILVVYGHHAMLERWWSLAQNLNAYGAVTMPDMPGFGGMESFTKIGIRPDLDSFADYMATFIKFRYKRKKVTIFAISFGFIVITRMLQRYPELAEKVNLLVSSVGFMHHDDFYWSPRKRFFFRLGTRLFATRPVAFLIRYLALNRRVIRRLTRLMPHSKHRFIEVTSQEFEETMDFEVKLWQANDVRTHWLTTSEFFSLDNTSKHISLPVVHVVSEYDHYFNNVKVEEHMRMVFTDYIRFTAKLKAHVPHVTADMKTTAAMLPVGLRRVLSKKVKEN